MKKMIGVSVLNYESFQVCHLLIYLLCFRILFCVFGHMKCMFNYINFVENKMDAEMSPMP